MSPTVVFVLQVTPKKSTNHPKVFSIACLDLPHHHDRKQQHQQFPLSGKFKIASIAYMSQLIWISDPSNCTAKRLLQGFDYSDTPFHPFYTRNFTFLNCTTDAPIFQSARVSPISCLSSKNYSVVALPTDRYNVSNMLRCMEITTFSYPSWGPGDSSDSLGDITLTWKEPDCQWCESIGGNCQFEDDMGSDVGCFKRLDPGAY